MEQIGVLGLIASGIWGVSVGMLVWWVVSALQYEEIEQADEWRYDVTRINELCRQSLIYRMTSGIMPSLAKLNRVALDNRLTRTAQELKAAGYSRSWLPEEYWATMEIFALVLFPFFAAIMVYLTGISGFVSAVGLSLVTIWLQRRRLARQANERLTAIKRRMPYLLDLLTLLMEAGSSFLQAMRQAVEEFEGHPVAVEFGRVLIDMNRGKSRKEAFDNMRNRLDDEEIGSIIGAMIQSEELGTPLTHALRSQAEVLRIKRSQRAEALAAEAGVNMLLPGVVVMAATLIVLLGPFLLNYFVFSFQI